MNEISLIIIFIFFTLSIIQIIIYSFFTGKKITRYTLVKSSITALIFLLFILTHYELVPLKLSSLSTITLLLFYPVTVSSLTAEFLGITRKSSVIYSFLASFALSLFSVIFAGLGIMLTSIWFALSYLYIIYILHRKNSKMFSFIIELYLALNMPVLIASAYYQSLFMLSLLAGLSSLLTFFIIVWLWKKNNSEYINLYNRSTGMIKKLNHRITRLKQSNEHYRRIIYEKDIEILQASRHASLAELTTGIAHELAQPLTGIRGIAQNMIDDIEYGEMEEKQAETDLLKICSLVDKSTSIIDHVRNFTKKSGYSMKPVDINRAILSAIDLVNIQLKNLFIDIVFDLNDDIPWIMGDNLSLEQLIVNIIQNSRDAILEKKEHLEKKSGQISITTSADTDRIFLKIADNGIGIPDEILHKIWSPFFTSKKRTYGTGIGLSISNKIIKAHNADVDIDTSRQGTIFTFIFPSHDKIS